MTGLIFNNRRTVALLAFSMVAIASWAQVFEQDGIKYRYESESLSVVVVSVFGKGDIVVPRTVVYNEQELPVTGMMSECFMDNKDVTSVCLYENIKEIPMYAFTGCSLERIDLPKGLETIRKHAFENACNLKEVKLPQSLKVIEESAFRYSGLSSLTLPDNIQTIGGEAFASTAIEEVSFHCADGTLQDNVFNFCERLRCVTIEEGTTNIRPNFAGCKSLESLYIPASVSQLDYFALNGARKEGNYLTSIQVDQGNKKYDSRGDCNAIIETETNALVFACPTTVMPKDIRSIKSYAFSSEKQTEIPIIPNGVEYISDLAFNCLNEIPSLVFEDGDKNLTLAYHFNARNDDIGFAAINSLYLGRNATWQGNGEEWDENIMTVGKLILGSGVSRLTCQVNFNTDGFSVYALSEEPQPLDIEFRNGDQIFFYTTLYVPIGSKEKYLQAEGWKKFLNIVEYDATSISSVSSASDSKVIYNLNGRRIASPQKGIYIQNGKKYFAK